jgi:hypothetical protein
MKHTSHACTTQVPDPAPLLEAVLLASAQMLIARHPDLLLPPDVPVLRPPPPLRAARALIGLINALLGALGDYNALQTPPLPPLSTSDEIPF